MAQRGQELWLGRHEKLTVVEPAADSGGEVLVVEAEWSPGGSPPPRHLHPSQDERFTILAGELEVTLGDDTRVYGPGEEVEVPRGTPHAMAPARGGSARARWEVRPALDTERFFERMSEASDHGARDIPKLAGARVLLAHRAEFRLALGKGS